MQLIFTLPCPAAHTRIRVQRVRQAAGPDRGGGRDAQTVRLPGRQQDRQTCQDWPGR